MPKGVEVKATKKKKPPAADAETDPRLTPSEKEWLKAAREEEAQDRASAEKAAAEDEENTAAADAENAAAQAARTGGDAGRDRSQGPNDASLAAAPGSDVAHGSASLVAGEVAGALGNTEGAVKRDAEGSSVKEAVAGAVVRENGLPLVSPSQRELTEWDAKRDALELKVGVPVVCRRRS